MMTDQQFEYWLKKLLQSYPQIVGAVLVGDRAEDQCREDCNWDVVVKLDDPCYRQVTRTDFNGMSAHNVICSEQIDKIEQRITFDENLAQLDPDEDVNLFFLRPDGHVGLWSWLELESLAEDTITGSVDHLRRIIETGLAHAKLTGAGGTIELAYTLFGRIPDRQEKKIRKQLRRAKVLHQHPLAGDWLPSMKTDGRLVP